MALAEQYKHQQTGGQLDETVGENPGVQITGQGITLSYPAEMQGILKHTGRRINIDHDSTFNILPASHQCVLEYAPFV